MYWLTGVLGLLLVLAPFVLGFTSNPAALWASVLPGAAVVVVSAIKGLRHDTIPWEYWVAGILGILAAALPFGLGFTTLHRALYTCTILGILIFILAVYQVIVAESRAQ